MMMRMIMNMVGCTRSTHCLGWIICDFFIPNQYFFPDVAKCEKNLRADQGHLIITNSTAVMINSVAVMILLCEKFTDKGRGNWTDVEIDLLNDRDKRWSTFKTKMIVRHRSSHNRGRRSIVLKSSPCATSSNQATKPKGPVTPAPVSEKKVLNESSALPIDLSDGICPSGWIPCSKQ